VVIPIYKVKNKGGFIYQFPACLGPNRKMVSRSNVLIAKAEAQRVAGAIYNQQANALTLDSAAAAQYQTAVRELEAVGSTLTPAVREYVSCIRLLPEGVTLGEAVRRGVRNLTVKPATVRELYAALLASRKAMQVTVVWERTLKSRLRSFVDEFGEDQIVTIETATLDRFLQERDQGIRTRNNRREALVLLFRFARDQGFLPRDTKTEADFVSRPKEKPRPVEIFSVDEIKALFLHASDRHVPYLALGCFAGIRTAEITRLQWQDFDWEEGLIRIEAERAKTGSTRFVPILPALLHALASLKEEAGPVVPGKIHEFGSALAKKAGMSWKTNGLRHSFASFRLPILNDAPKLASEMGNSQRIIYKNYHRLVKPSEAKKYWAIRVDELRESQGV
jgi:integrase